MGDEQAAGEVMRAAATIVRGYGAHDTEAYFAGFHPEATFVFHTSPERLGSTGEFRTEWERWEREDGFRVLSCRSSDQHVQVWGEVAVFTHTIDSVVRTADGDESSTERETIVFARQGDGRWLAVHEHLSPLPGDGD
jgi:ketosteroid isomerase-like protein